MTMMLGSMWLFRLFLLVLVLPLSNVAAARKHGKRMSAMMSDWTNPKFKKVKIPPELDRRFCGNSDDIAPRFDSPAIRKEYHTLTDEERTRFHDCVRRMKYDPYMSNSGVSEYNMFVFNHRNVSAPGAHAGPAFLPFHREFCTRFEQSLRNCDPKCFLPYWDSSLDASLPDPSYSAVFSEDYLGTSFGVVTKGFLAHWEVVPEDCQEMGRELMRECGNDGSLLMTEDKVESFLKKKSFREAVTPYDETFENAHGDVHSYMGGHMISLTCAPNDPVFFLHHTYIDYCYEKFRKLHPGSDNPKEYPDDREVPQYHERDDAMRPFYEKKNVDGLSSDYTKLWFQYEDSPKECDFDAQCRSKILWCDKLRRRCKSKVVETGDCTGLKDEACYCPEKDQTPRCIQLDEVAKCKCNKGSQQEGSSRCATSKDCQAGEWCDRKAGSCRKKVGLNGDCTAGMPSEACADTCVLPKLINCIQGKFVCAVQSCKFDDAECASTALWCNVARRQCDRKLRIGDRCYGFPDRACMGHCQENEQLKCRGSCQCV